MASVDYTVQVTLEAVNRASGTIDSVKKNMDDLQKQVDKTSGSVSSLGSALAGLGLAAGFKKIAGSVLELAGNLEQAEISFTTMLGSAEASEKMLKDLSDFAMKTPFELTGIRESAKQMLAMGISADDMIPTLKALGDVSSGLSIDLQRVALNYGQVATQGKLTGSELKDFTRMGVPLIAELAKNLNVAEKDINSMVSAGKIGFEDVKRAFETMTSEGGRFENLMDKQSTTLQGSISNLQDSFDHLKEEIGTLFIPILTKIVQAITPVIEKIGEWTEEHPRLTAAIGGAITAIVGLTGAVTVLLPLIKSVGVALGAIGPVGLAVGVAIAALTGIFMACATSEETLAEKSSRLDKEYKTLNEEVDTAYSNLDDLKGQADDLRKQQEDGIITQDEYNKAMDNSAGSIATETYALVQNTKAVIKNRIEKMKALQAQIDEEQKRDQETLEKGGTIMGAGQLAPMQGVYMSQQLQVGAEIYSLEQQIKDAEADLERYGDAAVNAYKRMGGEVSNTDNEVTNLNSNTKSSSKTNSDYLKAIKSRYDEINYSVNKQYDKITELNKEWQSGYDELNDKFEEADKNVKALKDDVNSLRKSLADLNKSETSDIASEFVSARREMQKMERDFGVGIKDVASQYSLDYLENYQHGGIGKYDIDALIQYKKYSDELESTYAGLNDQERQAMDEQIAYQEWYQSLNGVEKIKEDYRIKREEIQGELNEKLSALREEQIKRSEIEKQMAEYRKQWLETLNVELEKWKNLYLQKVDYEKKYMEQLEIDHLREMQLYDELISKLRQVAKAKANARDGYTGTRASGGPVYEGQSYLVGENGPEMFVPSQNGKIVPNNQMGGGEISVNINLGGVAIYNDNDEEQLVDKIKQGLVRELELYKRGIY